jgi:hypothetical protein
LAGKRFFIPRKNAFAFLAYASLGIGSKAAELSVFFPLSALNSSLTPSSLTGKLESPCALGYARKATDERGGAKSTGRAIWIF